MIDRRHFLIGAGALLTASFVRRASAFSQKAGRPLILPSVRKPEETLFVYMQDCGFDEDDEVAEYDAKWRVSLGPDQPFAPPPPTWREHLRALGHPLETHDEIERACMEHDLPLEEHADTSQRSVEELFYDTLNLDNIAVLTGIFPEETGGQVENLKFRLAISTSTSISRPGT